MAKSSESTQWSHLSETTIDMAASMVGSTLCVYSGQPFDTIKVRLQVGGSAPSLMDFFRHTIRSEGVTSLWRGSVPALAGAFAENAMAFATNGILTRFLTRDERYQNDISTQFLTGTATGLLCSLVLCPCDIIKCRAQVAISTGASSKAQPSITQLVRQQGISALYRGMTMQVARDASFYGFFFGSYELICRGLRRHTNWSDPSIYFVSGGLAGQISWAASIVPDTIKSRMQSTANNLTVRQTAREIVRAYGWKGLFAGLEVAIIRAFPANAALFFGYEVTKNVCKSF